MVNSVLLIKPQYLNLILSNEKSIEIRSCSCKSKVGDTIGLAYCGPLYRNKIKQIVATVMITSCCKYENYEEYAEDNRKHLYISNSLPYKRTYGWSFVDLKILDTPLPFEHKRGAIIWCKC